MTRTRDLWWHLALTILWTTSLVLGDSIPGPNSTSLALHCSAWRETEGGESRSGRSVEWKSRRVEEQESGREVDWVVSEHEWKGRRASEWLSREEEMQD